MKNPDTNNYQIDDEGDDIDMDYSDDVNTLCADDDSEDDE